MAQGHDGEASGAPGAADRTAVQTAFSLGWHLAELFHAEVPLTTPAPLPAVEDLPGLGELDGLTRARLVFQEIRMEAGRLVDSALATVALPDLTPVNSLLAAATRERGELRAAVVPVHIALLTALTAVDFRLGKAYGLGRAVAETSLIPKAADWASFTTSFAPYRLSTISQWLSDLKSQFPPHAAEAVRVSLWDWARWTTRPYMGLWGEQSGGVTATRAVDWDAPADLGRVTRAVRRQGEVWRSILGGEKRPLDLLSADDYVRAGERLFLRLGVLVGTYVRRYRAWLAGAVAVVAIVFVLLGLSGAGSAVAAGAVALAGAFGVTWKGVGSTLGTAVNQARRPLWDVELTAAVALAATRLPQEIVHGGG